MNDMSKRKIVSISVIALGLVGLSFSDSLSMDVSAETNGYNRMSGDWAHHNDDMNDHMSGGGMHGRNFRNEEWNQSYRHKNKDSKTVTENRRSDGSDRNNRNEESTHRTMWEWWDSADEDKNKDQLNYSENFLENMWGHMKEFTNDSYNGVNTWMDDMHKSFEWK